MAHPILFAFRGLLLLWTVNTLIDALEVKGHLPDISSISNFLEPFIRLYMHKNTNRYIDTPNMRAAPNNTTVEEAIHNKIAELKPLLQDHDEKNDSDDNLTLESKDDTTIIEFLPKIERSNMKNENNSKLNSFRAHIKKFKKMRNKIKKMLMKEKVSNNTRNTVINTLDEVMAQMIENQCAWNSADGSNKISRTLNTSISGMRRSSDYQWSKLRRQYNTILQKNLMGEGSILDMFKDFFTDVDTDLLTKHYKVQCRLVEVEKEKPTKPRYKTHGDKNNCENFKLCSEELKEFLIDFYVHLNDTVVSVYKNYAAMYLRDVIDTDSEKDSVASIINNIGDVAERKVVKLFKDRTNRIELDKKNDKNANIIHVNDYVKSTIEGINNSLKKRSDKQLSSLQTKLYLSVKEDLDVNLDVDLSNLERLFIDRICTQFVSCNGKLSSTRRWRQNVKSDGNNIYVQVHLTIDDQLKEDLKQLKLGDKTSANGLRRGVLREMYSNMTVTRTTIFNEDFKTPNITSVTFNVTKIDTNINEV